MSIHDRLRDEIYGSDEEKQELQDYADAASALLDFPAPHILGKRLLIAVAADVLIAAFVVFKPSIVVDLLDEYLVVIPFLVFALGFFIAFAVFRMYQQTFSQGEAPVEIDHGVMSGYAGYDRRTKHYLIWFVAAGGAIVNLAIIAALAWTF